MNAEGYKDPTADRAIANVTREQERIKYLVKAIRAVAGVYGFRIEGRIILKDEKTGRIWR
ncbi:MAG: hypothetical protein IJ706_08385 [Clostridia bacterium]|nr:hypothetical protein [Clostridia bacterium]